ncbi:hypothetical protein LTR86_011271 [Recurvomyces mirabilis]|nr:hypothetical protein LTR86_011271 [Recurvomyces mirabilis]
MVLGSADIDLDIVLSDSLLEVPPVKVAQWVALEAKSFDSLGFPERLGFIFLITRFLKWMILPSTENYRRVPSFMRPTDTQVEVPHSMCFDLIPWPDIRDALILDPTYHHTLARTSLGIAPFLSVNWQYSPGDIIEFDMSDGTWKLSALFERHIEDAGNWSVEHEAVDRMPILESKAGNGERMNKTRNLQGEAQL